MERDCRRAMVAANEGLNNLSTLLGDGNGKFGRPDYPIGFQPFSVATGDFNGDDVPDVVATNTVPDEVSVLLGTGAGSLSPEVRFTAGGFPASVAVADLNGDGRQDLAVANCEGASILLGNGDGTFGPATQFYAGTNPIAIAVADLDGVTKSPALKTVVGSAVFNTPMAGA